MRENEHDLGVHLEKEFANYDSHNNRTGNESSFEDEKILSIKREIIEVQNNLELPRSAKIL